MKTTLLFTIIGYFCGSLLFAKYLGHLFAKKDIAAHSSDGNPGAYNAYKYGGFLCGTATLSADITKGFLPVFIYTSVTTQPSDWGTALVVAAPVIGHAFSVFHKFKGGKGIAVTFGSLLGLAPNFIPAAVLGIVFILFSTLISIKPHYQRTMLTYLSSAVLMPFFEHSLGICAGFLIIAATVLVKLITSSEKREKMKVSFLWRS